MTTNNSKSDLIPDLSVLTNQDIQDFAAQDVPVIAARYLRILATRWAPSADALQHGTPAHGPDYWAGVRDICDQMQEQANELTATA